MIRVILNVKYFKIVLVLLLHFAFSTVLKSQCTYSSIDFDGFEYTTVNPGLVVGTVYHLPPQTYAAHTGFRGVYMNFVNGLSTNTLVYSKSYTVCPNSQYRFSTWFKLSFGGSSTVLLRVKDANNVVLGTATNTYPANSTWSQWVSVFTPSTSTITFELVYISGFGGNDLGMDDMELEICMPTVNNGTIDLCPTSIAIDLLDSLVAPSGSSGIWTGPSNLLNGSQGTFNPLNMNGGLYTYTVSNPVVGCPDSLGTLNISLGTGPSVNLGNDTTICQGDTLLVDATNTLATYLWQDGSTNPFYSITQSGTYWVEVTDSCGIDIDTINVVLNPLPFVDLGNDTTLCQGDTLFLDATANNASYSWNNNSISPLYNVISQGVYWVDVNVNSCITRDSINVSFNTLPTVNLGPDVALCQGDSIVFNVFNPNGTYVWQDNSVNDSLVVNQSGTYWVEVNLSNCVSSDTVLVIINPLPIVDLGNDTALCFGDTMIFDATYGNSSYLWQNNSVSPTFQVTQQGMYWVEVTENNCVSSDSIYVDYIAYPQVFLGNDITLCQGDTLVLDASNPNCTYTWQDNSVDSVYQVTMSGIYWVNVTRSICSSSDTISVLFNTVPVVNLGQDTIICENEFLMLSASNIGATYLWQDGSIWPYFQVNQPGTYWVEVANNNCIGYDTIQVDYTLLPVVDLGPDKDMCEGDTFVLNATYPNSSYSWQDNSTDSIFQVIGSGIYKVYVQNSCATVSDDIDVTYYSPPTVYLGEDTTICYGETLDLDAAYGNAEYLWSDNSTYSTLSIEKSQNIWVEVSNYCGTVKDSIEVYFEYCNCSLFIPNAFTPNGDGLDETFIPMANCELGYYQFIIYDRWGQEVFISNNPNESWDGTYKGKFVSVGLCTYVLKYYFNTSTKRKEYKTLVGSVNLIR